MDVTAIAQEVLVSLNQSTEGGLPADLNQAEALVRDQVRQLGARVLELHLEQRKLGYEGSSRACCCGRNQKYVEDRSRTLATTLGCVSYSRAYYRCRGCCRGAYPYDERCGLGPCQVSAEMAKAATLLAVHDPFSPSAEILWRLTGVRLSDRTINRLTHRAGKVASEKERAGALRMAAWAALPAEVRPRRLYVAVDGTMVHLEDGWREAKCVTCYWEDATGRREGRHCVRLETAEEFRAFVWSLACRCGLESADEVVLLGDGAAWIWDWIASILGERTICITDWYHVTEHVWDCGKALFGEGAEATEAWVDRIKSLLRKGRRKKLMELLERERRQRRGAGRAAVQGLVNYLTNQGDRIAYERFRARGMDIGSGRVEATCKQVGIRMKRSGMCWSKSGAQATLSLRSVWLNGDWDEFWHSRPLAA